MNFSISNAAVLLGLIFCAHLTSGQTLGGLSNPQQPDQHVKDLVQELSPQLNAKIYESCRSNSEYGASTCSYNQKFEPLLYRSQVVAGTNYFVKLRVTNLNNNAVSYWHARIFEQPWTNTKEVTSVSGPKGANDPIEYF